MGPSMIYVTSDIHGCYQAFIRLLEEINFSDSDFLYIIGDVIDRGKEPIETLKHVMKSSNMELILGNHEEFFLEALRSQVYGKRSFIDMDMWLKHGGDITYSQYTRLTHAEQESIKEYFQTRPLYKILDNVVLVHGGVSQIQKPYHSWEEFMSLQNRETLLWTKEKFLIKPFHISLEGRIIFGHTPTVEIRRILNEDKRKGRIWKDEKRWGIDGGYLFGGSLICIRLDDWKEFYIQNRDKAKDLSE